MIFSIIAIGAVLVVVVVLVVVIVFAKVETVKGEQDVMKNLYIYLVLFATLMMAIGGSVGAFMAVADIVVPVPYYQTFDEFKRMAIEKPDIDSQARDMDVKLSEGELKQQYEAMVSMENQRQINRAKNSLIKSFGWIIIPLPVFIYFQRRLAHQND